MKWSNSSTFPLVLLSMLTRLVKSSKIHTLFSFFLRNILLECYSTMKWKRMKRNNNEKKNKKKGRIRKKKISKENIEVWLQFFFLLNNCHLTFSPSSLILSNLQFINNQFCLFLFQQKVHIRLSVFIIVFLSLNWLTLPFLKAVSIF